MAEVGFLTNEELLVKYPALRVRRPARRFGRLLEMLESRVLLSANAGAVVASDQSTFANASLHFQNAALAVDLSLTFQHATSATGGSDYIATGLRLTQPSTGNALAAFQLQQQYAPGGPFTVTVSPGQDAMHLFGNFQLTNATGQTVTLALDVTWKTATVQTRTDTTQLELDSDGTRLLTTSWRSDATANVSAAVSWAAVDPTLQALVGALPGFPAIPFTAAAPGSFTAQSSQTQSLDSKTNAQPILQDLLPPSQTPRNAQVTFQRHAEATLALRASDSADVLGTIEAAVDQNTLTPPAPSVLPGSMSVILVPPTGGLLYSSASQTGIIIAPGGQTADVVVPALVLTDITHSVPNAVVGMDLHWQAQPTPASLIFTRSVTTTALATTTTYSLNSMYFAGVTGTLDTASAGIIAPRLTDATLSESRSVTIATPAKHAPAGDPTPVAAADWQASVVQPWQNAQQAALSADFVKPAKKKPTKLVTPAAWKQPFPLASIKIS